MSHKPKRAALSTATLTVAIIVTARRGLDTQLSDLVQPLEPIVIPLSESLAREAGIAYRQWGKGFHPASLNFGDCFAYALAMSRQCPLLFIGDGFSRTDIRSALEAET